MPPIGFVILTHSNPGQLGRLIRSLNALYGDPPIALHHDFAQCPADIPLPANVRLVKPSFPTAWGTISIVQAVLAGIATLFEGSVRPRWFALLSGSCYPTRTSAAALADLEGGEYDAYLHHERIDPMSPRRAFQEICAWRYFSWNIPAPGTGRRNLKTPAPLASQSSCFDRGFECYAGSMWFTARDRVAEFILRWSEDNPWLKEYLSGRPLPEETYFHSVVCNEKRFRVSQSNYRYIDWSAGGPHPKILGTDDLPRILEARAHFARKFEADSPVLDDIDRHLEPRTRSEPLPDQAPSPVTFPSAVQTAAGFKAAGSGVGTISVVIPTFQRAGLLEQALKSLEEQTDSNFEIIVVCDGADPETRALAQSYRTNIPLTWLFSSENMRAAAARNTGAAAATGEILLFLDDDSRADRSWVRSHRHRHEALGKMRPCLVLGRTVHSYLTEPTSRLERLLRAGRDARDRKFASVLGAPERHSPEEVQLYSVFGFNCSVSRAIFQQSGGFDPEMWPVFEDSELGLRLHAMGIETVVEPDAVVVHQETKTLVLSTRTYWKNGMRLGLYRLTRKGQRNAQLAAFRALRTKNPARRLFHAIAWHTPGMVGALGKAAGAISNRTGSTFFLRQWERLVSASDGMESLRAAGVTRKQLRDLVGEPLLVLAVHNIAAELSAEDRKYHLTPPRFRALLRTLARLNFSNVALEDGFRASRGFVLTLDDGYEDLHAELLPLVESEPLKPLVFVVVDKLGSFNDWESPMGYGRRRLLSVSQIREMHRCGISFGSHSNTHPWLPSLTEADLEREISGSKKKLEDVIGAEVSSFAYPYGGASPHVRATVARAGYKWGFSVSPGKSFWDDPMWIKRVEVAEKDSTADVLLKLATGKSVSQHCYDQLTRLRRALRLEKARKPHEDGGQTWPETANK